MFIADIKRVVDQVSRDKGIDREVLIKALEEALRSAARKKFGNKIDIEVQYSEETGEIEVFQFKEVVAEVEEPDLQITLEDGRELDPECEIGDSIGTKMDTATFGRINILDVEDFPIIRHWYVLQRKGKRLSPAAQAFKEFVLNQAAQFIRLPK